MVDRSIGQAFVCYHLFEEPDRRSQLNFLKTCIKPNSQGPTFFVLHVFVCILLFA